VQRRVSIALFLFVAGGCTGVMGTPEPGADGGSRVRPDVFFMRPDSYTVDGAYVPQPGNCGFGDGGAPAFCETFESGPTTTPGPRSGELDPARWSVTRGTPGMDPHTNSVGRVGPMLIESCRPGLVDAMVVPDGDTLICDPSPTIASRYLLTGVAAQNYGLNTFRIRQPFDFAGRTGTIRFDMETGGGQGWPSITIAEDPTPTPSYGELERGSGPRNGFEIVFDRACSREHALSPRISAYVDYHEVPILSENEPHMWQCGDEWAQMGPGQLNHIEIYLTQTRVEIWASDASPDGVTFPHFHRVWASDIDLTFSRGYITIAEYNHASIKYWHGAGVIARWDNIGFDGPAITNWREYSAPEPLQPYRGVAGCRIDGQCQWIGRVIPHYPQSMCGEDAGCTFDAEGRTTGHVVPSTEEPPLRLEFQNVSVAGATSARIVFAASYPSMPWNDVPFPPSGFNFRYRLNGGAWHDRRMTQGEINAFNVEHGPGFLNQTADVPVAELHDGTNAIEIAASGAPAAFRVGMASLDLVLTTTP
jgi:hypothetical protein